MRHHVDLLNGLYFFFFFFFTSRNHPHKRRGKNKKGGVKLPLCANGSDIPVVKETSQEETEACGHNRAVSTATTAVYTAVVNLHKGKAKSLS